MLSRIRNIKDIDEYVNVCIDDDDVISFEILPVNEEGLTMNEFIMASKINEIPTLDLILKKKQRFWA